MESKKNLFKLVEHGEGLSVKTHNALKKKINELMDCFLHRKLKLFLAYSRSLILCYKKKRFILFSVCVDRVRVGANLEPRSPAGKHLTV